MPSTSHKSKSHSLFKPLIPKSNQHSSFRLISNGSFHAETRQVMENVFSRLRPIDPHFVTEFQGKGFDARVWELCLFAMLEEQGCSFDRTYRQPDFLVKCAGDVIGIEATTTGPSEATPALDDTSEDRPERISEIRRH